MVVQAPAPARLIEGGLLTEATVAQVLVSRGTECAGGNLCDLRERHPPAYCAVHAPSTAMAVPVICSAASEHRKATVPPSCSGVTKVIDGCFSPRS